MCGQFAGPVSLQQQMKTCPQCKTSVSDEYRYCLNCGGTLDASVARAEEPLPTLVYQGQISQPGDVSAMPAVLPTMPSGPGPTSADSQSRTWLPWLLVLVCVTTISVLVAILIVSRQRPPVAETVAPPQAGKTSPTATASDLALNPNVNQPAPFSSVSPSEKKQPTATPTPAAAVVNNPRPALSTTPTPTPVSTPTPTPAPAVDTNRVYSNREVSERARIASQPKPGYTEEARKNQVAGIVVLRVVLRFDGTIGNITVVSGLPDGLTEQAIAAARNIRFTPAQKDGVPVSVSMQVEYRFNLY